MTWKNPEIKLKIDEKAGSLVVYLTKKRLPGCYVKVFA